MEGEMIKVISAMLSYIGNNKSSVFVEMALIRAEVLPN